MTSATALVMAVVWAYRNEPRHPTNAEIARRSGIRGGPDAVRYHLAKLEGAGHIRRHGHHRNRRFRVADPDVEHLGLTIHPDVFHSSLSPTQKIMASAMRAFRQAGPGWICERSGIEPHTYYRNIALLEPLKKCQLNPLKNVSEPLKKCQALVERGEESGSCKTLTGFGGVPGGAAPADDSSPEQEKINTGLSKGADMPTMVNVTLKDMRRADAPSRKPKRTKPNQLKETSPAVIELKHEVYSHKYFTRHTTTRQTKKALEVIDALQRPGGVSTVLSDIQFKHIVETMSNQKVAPMTSEQVRAALTRQFDDPFERIELYRKLSDNQSPECGGPGKRRALADMVYDGRANPGWSDFVKVVVNGQPKPKTKQQPTPIIPEELQAPVRMIERSFPDEPRQFIVRTAKELHRWHRENEQPQGYGNFNGWLRGYLNWLETTEGSVQGDRGLWRLSTRSKTFADWVSTTWRRADETLATRRRTASEEAWEARLKEIERAGVWMSEYGYEAAVEAFGQDIVDEIQTW